MNYIGSTSDWLHVLDYLTVKYQNILKDFTPPSRNCFDFKGDKIFPKSYVDFICAGGEKFTFLGGAADRGVWATKHFFLRLRLACLGILVEDMIHMRQ